MNSKTKTLVLVGLLVAGILASAGFSLSLLPGFTINVTPTSGNAPLTVSITGSYPTSGRSINLLINGVIVDSTMSNSSRYTFNYCFASPGTFLVYAVHYANNDIGRPIEYETPQVSVTVSGVASPTRTLTVDVEGSGYTTPQGTITYAVGQSVTILAEATVGQFGHWVLDGQIVPNVAPTLTVSMTVDHHVTAVFGGNIYGFYLSVFVLPSGSGILDTQSGWFAEGSSVAVSATASSGFLFDHWILGGASSGSSPSITVAMTSDRTLVAYFVSTYVPPPPAGSYSLTVLVNGSGTVSQGNGTFTSGTALSITATPSLIAGGSNVFSYWLLDGVQSSANPIAVTMGGDHVLIAVFTYIPDFSAYAVPAIAIALVIVAIAVVAARRRRPS